MADYEHGTTTPITIDAEPFDDTPSPRQINLASLADVRREMARTYRLVEKGNLSGSEGGRRIWMLSSIAKVIETSEIEIRVADLADKVEQFIQRRLK